MQVRKHISKFAQNFRFYFTSAKFSQIEGFSKGEVKQLVATQKAFDGMLMNTEEHKDEETLEHAPLLETKLIDTSRNKIKSDVILICLGDSKGYLHFNHVFL